MSNESKGSSIILERINQRNSFKSKEIDTQFNLGYFTLFISFLTSFLFAIGYLIETVHLEKFGLNSYELMPDTTTAITIGFRYVFMNSVAGAAVGSIYTISVILMIPHMKGAFNGFPRIQNVINDIRKHCYNFLGLYLPLRNIILILSFIFFPIVVSVHAINQTSTSANDMLNRTINVDIVELKTKPVSFLKGKVVRLRNGVLIFRDYESNETVLIPVSEFRSIKYNVIDSALIATVGN
ncbi:MAG: hypothetical protein RPR97_18760 [Colwellia sp.]